MVEKKNITDENSGDQNVPNNQVSQQTPSDHHANISESPAEHERRSAVDNSAPGPFEDDASEEHEPENMRKEISINNEDKMETFHPHHVHHRKRWKDYLFEFFMLFLAVTAGFFVENRREHFVENRRAAQYSKQLLADLRLDSAVFENRNHDIESRQKWHDSLRYLLTEKLNASNREVLEALFAVSFVYDLPVTTTTYNQMKTSGSLRYIESQKLTASLQNYYDVLLPRCNKLADASLAYYMQYINPYYLTHLRVQDYDSYNDSLINKQPVILNRTKQTDQELANVIGGFRSLLKIQLETMNKPALAGIKETMRLLKEEYRVD
jgi:hypothetical protein